MVHTLLADISFPGRLSDRSGWEFCLPAAVLIGVLGLGIWAVLKIKRWHDEECASEIVATEQQLEHYQQMVDDGLLDPEEFARIKTQFEARLADQASIREGPPNQPPDTSIQEK
ncbi:MAG: hypothetical protein EXR98_09785 [Gemmataceae bacterium]|nr:hypothetical protein [Gemmataceae bacterium]